MKTVITILADLVRSLVLSGLAAVAWLVLGGALLLAALVALWRLLRQRSPRP